MAKTKPIHDVVTGAPESTLVTEGLFVKAGLSQAGLSHGQDDLVLTEEVVLAELSQDVAKPRLPE